MDQQGYSVGKVLPVNSRKALSKQACKQHVLVEKEPKLQEVLKPFRVVNRARAIPSSFLSTYFYPHPPITYIHPKCLIQCHKYANTQSLFFFTSEIPWFLEGWWENCQPVGNTNYVKNESIPLPQHGWNSRVEEVAFIFHSLLGHFPSVYTIVTAPQPLYWPGLSLSIPQLCWPSLILWYRNNNLWSDIRRNLCFQTPTMGLFEWAVFSKVHEEKYIFTQACGTCKEITGSWEALPAECLSQGVVTSLTWGPITARCLSVGQLPKASLIATW